MNYSLILNDIVDVDALIAKIKTYSVFFEKEEEFFIHCKNVERFERNLESQVPKLSHQISQIYGSGRDLAISVASHINACLDIEINPLLKDAIDKLDIQLNFLRSWGLSEHDKIRKIYEQANYSESSVNHMFSSTLKMCEKIAEIIQIINFVKQSYSYKIQSGELTLNEVRNLTGTNMNTTNNYNNSLISNGNNNTNTLNNNFNKPENILEIFERLRDIIDSSSLQENEKNKGHLIVNEMSSTNDKTQFQQAYNKLTTFMSNHITIGTAILSADILPSLAQCLS